jgi:hypothetical protein
MIGAARLAALIIGSMLVGCQARAEPAQTGYSAAGLYNLANSYARAGKPGMAVLNYERASLLAPNDPDIEANLRYIRESSRLPLQPRNWFERSVRVASPRVLSWLGLFGLLVAGLSVLAGRLHAPYRLMRRGATVVGLALVGLTACNAILVWPKLHEGVVIASATPVRVSPVPMGDPLFVLPEAEIVRMTAEHEGFVLVQTRLGRVGWVSRANLAPVLPRNSNDAR